MTGRSATARFERKVMTQDANERPADHPVAMRELAERPGNVRCVICLHRSVGLNLVSQAKSLV